MNLREEVDALIAIALDREAFHIEQDELMMRWIRDHATEAELVEWERLWSDEFILWYS